MVRCHRHMCALVSSGLTGAMRTRVIAVIGATGRQGGGLARAILADRDNEFSVRAFTRDPASTKALALAAAGGTDRLVTEVETRVRAHSREPS